MPRSAWMRESDHRITRALVRSGVLVAQEYDDEEQLWLDLDPEGEDALTQLQGASIRFAVAVGPIAGRKTLRLHTPGAALDGPGREPPKPFTAARDGFSLNAAVGCNAGERRKLERLCRYVARPAIALERLSRDGDGLVVYELKHPFRDGTTLCAVQGCTNVAGGRQGLLLQSFCISAIPGGQMPEATSPTRG